MTRILAALGILHLTVAAFDAPAQTYPARPVRIIFAQSAGSSLDTTGRIVTNKLTEVMGQQFVVDNRGGAAGTIGCEIAARATPDGYTLLLGASSSMIVSRYAYRKLGFDAFKDFDPISLIVNTDSVMAVHPSLPVKSVKDLIALARAQPGKLNMSSAGMGSSSHLAGTMFTSMTGINTVHVPYKGGGPMAAAVVANESQWVIAPAAAIAGHIRAGRLRGIAIASEDAIAAASRPADDRRKRCPGLRLFQLVGFLRAARHAETDHHHVALCHAEGARGARPEGAVCDPGRCAARQRESRSVRAILPRRQRAFGASDQACRHQARVVRHPASIAGS